jgi:hypothetical protein
LVNSSRALLQVSLPGDIELINSWPPPESSALAKCSFPQLRTHVAHFFALWTWTLKETDDLFAHDGAEHPETDVLQIEKLCCIVGAYYEYCVRRILMKNIEPLPGLNVPFYRELIASMGSAGINPRRHSWINLAIGYLHAITSTYSLALFHELPSPPILFKPLEELSHEGVLDLQRTQTYSSPQATLKNRMVTGVLTLLAKAYENSKRLTGFHSDHFHPSIFLSLTC